ncbi:MAG: hypothetical protein COW93_02485 [Parcubacteria group bacterium CG22_combo_CG10-13_8_21_14_all_41_9]|nr:MAG: hypothetical protein COW93_02485 [Parcubacteria group bacterium CG22_combo_CG10-13_8_21_14_all_41_9]
MVFNQAESSAFVGGDGGSLLQPMKATAAAAIAVRKNKSFFTFFLRHVFLGKIARGTIFICEIISIPHFKVFCKL